jgi:3-deoxy-D-manno-octulosonic-acid transferase
MGRSAKISKMSRTGRLPFKQRRLARELAKHQARSSTALVEDSSVVDEVVQLREWRQRKKIIAAKAKQIIEEERGELQTTAEQVELE